jgi:hypothetical protein
LTLYYDEAEGAAADLICQACDRCVPTLKVGWGLPSPADCRIYVMTSWVRFVFHSAPWPRRIAYALFFPIVWLQAARVWKYAGGWNLPQGRRMAVGIKPPHLIEASDRGLGLQLFLPAASAEETVRRIVCHEITHAFSTHLRLPIWLHEGLAMVTVDRALGQPTVRPETLGRLQHIRPPATRIRLREPDAVLDLYARGYWLTRYLTEAQPEFLRSLLVHPQPWAGVEQAVADKLQLTGRDLWGAVGPILATHFGAGPAPTPRR